MSAKLTTQHSTYGNSHEATPTPEEVALAATVAQELRSLHCICGHRKKEEQPFCRLCYGHLPVPMRANLQTSFRDGYIQHHAAAKQWLAEHTDRLKHVKGVA